MSNEYGWKSGSAIPLDANVVGQEIEKLQEVRGFVTPVDLVDEARSEASPLHPAFTWDDARAGDLRRLDEARSILRHITIRIIRDEPQSEPLVMRALVHVTSGDGGARYVPIMVAMHDIDLRAEVIARAQSELATWARRYREYEELAGIVTAVESWFANRQAA